MEKTKQDIRNYLIENGTNTLINDWKVKLVRHKEYKNLFLLKYNQIDSPINDITTQCRGIILDEDYNYKIIAYSYDRFFNYGEGHAASIDWNTAVCYEKVDGSLCQLYYYDNKWHIATSGTPDASGNVNGLEFSFKDLFWKTWNELNYKLPDHNYQSYTFAFELMTKYNKIIVQHNKPSIVLHGARDNSKINNYCQITVEQAEFEDFNWEIIKTYPLNNIEDIIKLSKEINPIDCEGFVVCDANFNRIKIKSPQYVALNHLKDGWGPKRILEIIRTNEMSEFLQYFPEWTSEYDNYKSKFDILVQDLEDLYNKNKHIDNPKEFAIQVKNHKLSGALFAMKRGKTSSIKEYLSSINIDSLLYYFEIK